MSNHPLIDTLSRFGVTLTAEGDDLRIHAPRGIVNADSLAIIRQNKASILDALANCGGRKCPRCGSPETRDVPIHNGQSVRRDCSSCGRTIGFPEWQSGPPKAATGANGN